MLRYVFNWLPSTRKNMFSSKLSTQAKPSFLFKTPPNYVLPPMKLNVVTKMSPPPLNPGPDYSFLVALCFGFFVFFNKFPLHVK